MASLQLKVGQDLTPVHPVHSGGLTPPSVCEFFRPLQWTMPSTEGVYGPDRAFADLQKHLRPLLVPGTDRAQLLTLSQVHAWCRSAGRGQASSQASGTGELAAR